MEQVRHPAHCLPAGMPDAGVRQLGVEAGRSYPGDHSARPCQAGQDRRYAGMKRGMQVMARTKTVCTIGPSSRDQSILEAMIAEGMNVARLNFSHGSHESHAAVIERIRAVSDAKDIPVAILQDLCGPKIRVGAIDPPGIRLEPGDTLTLTNQPASGGQNRVTVSYAHLPQDVEEGDVILLADGMMELDVQRTTETDI